MKKKKLCQILVSDPIDSLQDYHLYQRVISSIGQTNGSFIWGSGSGNCFFNCMAFLGSKYGIHNSSDFYQEKYHDCSFWRLGGQVDSTRIGPSDYKVVEGKTIPNPDSFEYLNTFFKTSNNSWEENQDSIDDYLKNKKKKEYVLGIISSNEGDAHAIILDRDGGDRYTYKDPTSGENDLEVSKENLEYATKIMGKKNDE